MLSSNAILSCYLCTHRIPALSVKPTEIFDRSKIWKKKKISKGSKHQAMRTRSRNFSATPIQFHDCLCPTKAHPRPKIHNKRNCYHPICKWATHFIWIWNPNKLACNKKKSNVHESTANAMPCWVALVKLHDSHFGHVLKTIWYQVPSVYEEMILSGCTPDRKARAMLRSALQYMKQTLRS